MNILILGVFTLWSVLNSSLCASSTPIVNKMTEAEIMAGAKEAIKDPEIVWEYFSNIAFGSEFSDEENQKLIRKWKGEIIVFVAGENLLYHRLLVAEFVQELDVVLPIKIRMYDLRRDTDNANLGIFFVSDFKKAIFETYRRDFESIYTRAHNNKDFMKEEYKSLRKQQDVNAFASIISTKFYETIFSMLFVSTKLEPERVVGALKEELTQSLGLMNDVRHLLYTRFNDKEEVLRLTPMDWLLLKILYHDQLKTGMSKEEVKKIFLEVYQDVYKEKVE